jgi:threonine dehydratase
MAGLRQTLNRLLRGNNMSKSNHDEALEDILKAKAALNLAERTEEIKERSLMYEGLKHYFMIQFPQRPGALREFVNEVLSESDDITYFQFIKKNNRDVGPVVVGLEVKNENDIQAIKEKMNSKGFQFEYLNENDPLLALLI